MRLTPLGFLFVSLLALPACGEPSPRIVDAAPNLDSTPDASRDATLPDARIIDARLDGSPEDANPADAEVEAGWRSVLYPVDWTPDLTDSEGRFLHDFSYAGYRNGEATLGSAIPSASIDVVAAHGADPTGASDSTTAIQAAIDAAVAMGGAVVSIPEGLYRIDSELVVGGSRVVIRGEGPTRSRLHFTSHEGRSHKAHLLFRGSTSHDLEISLTDDVESRSFDVLVADAGALAVGDDITLGWVITDAFVEDHEMVGTWGAFNGDWQPFFWRTIVEIDRSLSPHRIRLDVPLRYPARVRDSASIRRHPSLLTECGVESIGLANAVRWSDAWAQNQVHVLGFDGVKDSWIRDVHSFEPPTSPSSGRGRGTHLQSSGIRVRRSMRVTVADSRMELAEHRGGGGNGYLFEVRQSSEILFRDCDARAGRHNFIQNWGFGATGIVWLRVDSRDGRAFFSESSPLSQPGYSEFHHSLATANLIDQSYFEDGWSAVNRGDYSSGAGHSATENVVWNASGSGDIRSAQYGWGYVIGTAAETSVTTRPLASARRGTAPEDYVEGRGEGDTLTPSSLYESQLMRRLAP